VSERLRFCPVPEGKRPGVIDRLGSWVAVLALALAAVVGVVQPPGVRASPTLAAAPVVTDQVVASFDGTPIVTTLFLPDGADAASPAPLVLHTHGWAGTRQTDPAGFVGRLLDEGYAVLTWDQRGFGCSGGEVRIDDPQVEGRDVSALIDWAVANAPIATDGGGDPIVGATGGSYAGGIQTATASIDPRLDALAPEISWSDLRYSLNAGGVTNQGWTMILYLAGVATAELQGLDPSCPAGPQAGGLDPAIHAGVGEFLSEGTPSSATLDFFAKSSLAHYGQTDPVAVPTLVVNGSVDTLFDLTDGWGIVEHLQAQGVPARFMAFCGGHVGCPSTYAAADDGGHVDDAVLRWFARYLRGDDVDTGPPVEYRTNAGEWRAVDTFPAGADGPGVLTVDGSATTLPVVPIVDFPGLEQLAAEFASEGGTLPPTPFTAAQPTAEGDPRAATFEVVAAGDEPLEVLGIPEVDLTVTGQVVPLDEAVAPVADALGPAFGPYAEQGDVLVGELGPAGPLVGSLAGGAIGGAGQDGHVHLFVRLVHREAGEVLNLQEGTVRVDLGPGEASAAVPMPGLAYTVPPGHHLDLQVSTASVMSATGRTPGFVDVGVTATIPLAGPAPSTDPPPPPTNPPPPTDPPPTDPPPTDPPPTDPPPTDPPAAAPAASPTGRATLPATGGSSPIWAALGLVAAALALHRLHTTARQ
jgi:ABC-2 type transport system ATP-binding protein